MADRLRAPEELADRIEQVLNRGGRHYTLAGAELDWVIKALREPMLAFNSDAYGEKTPKSKGGCLCCGSSHHVRLECPFFKV